MLPEMGKIAGDVGSKLSETFHNIDFDKRIEPGLERMDKSEVQQPFDPDKRVEISEMPKEMSFDEINNLQKEEIGKAFEKIRNLENGDDISSVEKGNLGEMMMDQYYIKHGYTPLKEPRVTDLEKPAGKGLDGVYEKVNPDGTKEYIVSDAKVNGSKLHILSDGTLQLSDNYTFPARLEEAVGKEKADEIKDAYEDNPQCLKREVYHLETPSKSPDGCARSDTFSVDADGMSNHDKRYVEAFDEYGHNDTMERQQI